MLQGLRLESVLGFLADSEGSSLQPKEPIRPQGIAPRLFKIFKGAVAFSILPADHCADLVVERRPAQRALYLLLEPFLYARLMEDVHLGKAFRGARLSYPALMWLLILRVLLFSLLLLAIASCTTISGCFALLFGAS